MSDFISYPLDHAHRHYLDMAHDIRRACAEYGLSTVTAIVAEYRVEGR